MTGVLSNPDLTLKGVLTTPDPINIMHKTQFILSGGGGGLKIVLDFFLAHIMSLLILLGVIRTYLEIYLFLFLALRNARKSLTKLRNTLKIWLFSFAFFFSKYYLFCHPPKSLSISYVFPFLLLSFLFSLSSPISFFLNSFLFPVYIVDTL